MWIDCWLFSFIPTVKAISSLCVMRYELTYLYSPI
jgi:hypothetical protein